MNSIGAAQSLFVPCDTKDSRGTSLFHRHVTIRPAHVTNVMMKLAVSEEGRIFVEVKTGRTWTVVLRPDQASLSSSPKVLGAPPAQTRPDVRCEVTMSPLRCLEAVLWL